MTETPALPDESRVEAAARLAAEAAVATLLPRLEALEQAAAQPPAPAVPAGLESRINGIENAVQLALQPAPAPTAKLSEEDRRIIDDLRLARRHHERTLEQLTKETP